MTNFYTFIEKKMTYFLGKTLIKFIFLLVHLQKTFNLNIATLEHDMSRLMQPIEHYRPSIIPPSYKHISLPYYTDEPNEPIDLGTSRSVIGTKSDRKTDSIAM